MHRIVADRDVAVHQSDALESSGSNDASMLLPVTALGTQYRVLAYRDTVADFGHKGGDSYAQIVAAARARPG